MRMWTLLRIGLLCIALDAAVGCHRLPDRKFAALDGALTLRVVRVSPVGTTKTRVDLALTSRGRSRAQACLGPNRIILGVSGLGIDMVHHPGCVREFELDSGGVLAWSETYDGTVAPESQGHVSVEVQILNPRRCSSVGCAEFQVRSLPG